MMAIGRQSSTALCALLVAAGVSCAVHEGTEPEDMSVRGHEAAAGAEEAEATEHEAQYAAGASGAAKPCEAGPGRVCWTAEHREEAERHRELAARHRGASQSLRNAEETACEGVAAEDREVSPFAHREDIRQVFELTDVPGPEPSLSGQEIRGATVVFRPVPGLTAEWFQHLLDCHLAQHRAAGYEMQGMENSPLALPHAQARVRPVGDTLAVDVSSDDPDTAREILRRAGTLKAR